MPRRSRSMTASPTRAAARCAAYAGRAAFICTARPWRATHALNRFLRQEAGLGGRVRELAILVTARELDSQFEWAAHEEEARREGLSPEIIETIRHRRDTSGLDDADAAVIELGREVFTARKVKSETFARALELFGRKKLVDLVALMGNYAATAAMLTAFDMQLDPDQTPPLPARS